MSGSRESEPTRSQSLHRRDALVTAGLLSVAALGSNSARASSHQGERSYEGESAAGNIQEALDAALAKVSNDLGEGGVSDALATWKIDEVTGQLGGIAGFHSTKVTLIATRVPPWLNPPGKS